MNAIAALGDAKPKSPKLAYKLGRIVKFARDEAGTLADAQTKLLELHGTPVDGMPGQFEIPAENRAAFNAGWKDLLSTEIEWWGDPIDVGTVDGDLALSVADYAALGWLFTDSDGKPGGGKSESQRERTGGEQ